MVSYMIWNGRQLTHRTPQLNSLLPNWYGDEPSWLPKQEEQP
jgi:hypothetical protein